MINQEDYEKWLTNKSINPSTGRSIKIGGPIYKRYEEYELTLMNDRSTIRAILAQEFNKYTHLTNICLPSPKIKNFLTDIYLIGSGSFGQVFSGVFRNVHIAAKQSLLSIKERNEVMRNIAAGQKTLFNKCYPNEYRFQVLTQKLLDDNKSQNFLNIYGLSFCKDGEITLHNRLKKGSCYITFMELADESLSSVSLRTEQTHCNMLFQLLAALHILQKIYSILHNDIKAENILIKRIPPGGVWEYVIQNKSYFVANIGFIALINDFGVSRSFSPDYTLDGYLGERNAVIEDGKFVPFKMDYFLTIDNGKLSKEKPYYFNWKVRNSGTRNRFHKKLTYPSNMDSQYIPPFEFFFDLQDIVRMFIGGKRLFQPGYHKAISSDAQFIQKLRKYCKETMLLTTQWPLDSVKFFLAGAMLEDFFTLSEPKEKVIIARYIDS
jgi:2-cysteine adaptor domain./Protein kinase domain.